jgi:HEAT repeat protein
MTENVDDDLGCLEHGTLEGIWEAAKRLDSVNLEIRHTALVLLNSGERPETRAAAAYILGFARDAGARTDLEERVRDRWEEPTVRGHAAEALAYIGDPRSVPSLLDALEEDDSCVRYWCIFALGQIGGRDVLPMLTTVMDQVGEEQWDGNSLRTEALDAVAEIERRLADRDNFA